MTNIIDLAKFKERRDDDAPSLSVALKCYNCSYEWRAVTPHPLQGSNFTCPKCDCERGMPMGFIVPFDEYVYTCTCGNDMFRILPEAMLCVVCGERYDRDV